MELQWEQASLHELSVDGCQLKGGVMVLRRAARGTLDKGREGPIAICDIYCGGIDDTQTFTDPPDNVSIGIFLLL